MKLDSTIISTVEELLGTHCIGHMMRRPQLIPFKLNV